jgi:hypothetical protein
MSAPDASPPNAPNPATSGDEPRRSGGSSTRLVVLLLILLVAGAAAGWDYLIARPAFYQAQDKVKPLLPGSDADADKGDVTPSVSAPIDATQKDVHAALGLTPAATEPAGSYLVERYSWRRGIPWMTYDLWVIYDDDERRTLRNATSVREEADLYYATARQADSAPTGSDPLNESPAGASEPPLEDATESSADAKAEDADSPADEAPEAAADES